MARYVINIDTSIDISLPLLAETCLNFEELYVPFYLNFLDLKNQQIKLFALYISVQKSIKRAMSAMSPRFS